MSTALSATLFQGYALRAAWFWGDRETAECAPSSAGVITRPKTAEKDIFVPFSKEKCIVGPRCSCYKYGVEMVVRQIDYILDTSINQIVRGNNELHTLSKVC